MLTIHSYLHSDILTHMNLLMNSLAHQHGHIFTHTQPHSRRLILNYTHRHAHTFTQVHKYAYEHIYMMNVNI